MAGDLETGPVADGPVYTRLNPTCGLCHIPFKHGDQFRAFYPRQRGLGLSITCHTACVEQLQPGDLSVVYQALELGLHKPLAVLRDLAARGVL